MQAGPSVPGVVTYSAMSIDESALVLLVPECEDLVGPWRRLFDQAAIFGVPAHVTVLYPFVPPRLIDDALKVQLNSLFGTFSAFEFSLTQTRRFDDRVLYLAPSPVEPFDQLTRVVTELFPDYPPYEGRFESVLAHLTVADRASPDQLDVVDSALSAGLPIHASAHRVSLLVGSDEPATWHVMEEFALGGGS